MSAQITLDWKKDSTFETQMDGHTVTIDTSKEDGRAPVPVSARKP